jgi:hypothetical protein
MGAREYDPSLGRWLSADTIVPEPGNPQSLNRYSYVSNNPLKYIDPTGHTYYPPGCEHSEQCMDWWDKEHGIGPAEMGGLMLEMAVKPSNWSAWWKYVVTQEYTAEEYVRNVDYEGTLLAGELGLGIGDNWKGGGIGFSFNPDNTNAWGYGGSYGPLSLGVNPQDGVPSAGWKLPIGEKTTLRPKYGSGTWGATLKPPLGVSGKIGENRYGYYVGVGYTQKVEFLSVSGEVTAYGGMVDTVAEPVISTGEVCYWKAAENAYKLSVIVSYNLLGPDLTRQLFQPR